MRHTIFISMLILCLTPAFAQHEIFASSGTAIGGYDPVAYFKEAKPVKGKDAFSFSWKGVTWKFSNAANLEAFKSDPERFAPQFGGFCAFGVTKGKKATTEPDAWSIVDDKLYLNHNADIKAKWDEKQDEYIELGNTNWQTVKARE